MNAISIEFCQGVINHLSFKVMYLLPDDTQGWRNLTGIESMSFIDILYTRLDDMSFRLMHTNIFSANQVCRREMFSFIY